MNTSQVNNSSRWPLWISLTLGVVSALILLINITLPIESKDIWWHITLGQQVLQSGSLVLDHSIFTWTPAIPYHTYNAWLGQIFFYQVDNIAGVYGLIAVRFGIYFLLFILGWSYAVKRGIARHPLTWGILLVSLALVVPSYIIKPGLLTLGFMTIIVWLYFLIRSTGESARYLVYLFPLILVLWANVHGGFFLSAPFFLLIAIGELLNKKYNRQLSMTPRLQKHFFIALILSVLAIFITPYGYEMPFDIIKLVLDRGDYSMGRISEYRPTFTLNAPPFYILDYLNIAMLIFVFLIWQLLKNGKSDWVVILVFIAYSVLFIQITRTTYFLGPVFLFVSLDLLAEKKSSWAWPNTLTSKSILTVVSISIFTLIGWRAISNNDCVKIQDKISQMFDISSRSISVEAEYIAKNLPGNNIGNLYEDGGYLIYRLWPEKRVLIDSRSFPFKNWIKEYFEQFSDARDIPAFIKKYPADFWLITYKNHKIFQWFFKSPNWELSYLGPNAGIFEPGSSDKIKTVISSHITEMTDILGIAFALTTSLNINNFNFARTLHNAAMRNLNQDCPKHKAFTDRAARSIDGYEAFNAGNYKLAAELLGENGTYLKTSAKAVQAYMKLAEQSFNSGNFYKARNLIEKAFNLLPVKLMEDIYNMAVTDWHYRHSDQNKSHIISDELHWQKLVQIILDNKQLVPKNNAIILETAKAMSEGNYDGNGSLIPRRSE